MGVQPLGSGWVAIFSQNPVWLPQSNDSQLDTALQEIPSVPGEQEAQEA